jgi:hypothetical protein
MKVTSKNTLSINSRKSLEARRISKSVKWLSKWVVKVEKE